MDPQSRAQALDVVRRVYLEEKGWIADLESEVPTGTRAEAAPSGEVSWFLARREGYPMGVLRITYDPPLELPAELEVELDENLDLSVLARLRIAEVGRFMIRPSHRGNINVALKLMKAAIGEVIERGYSHLLTDVFEDDPHSPLGFHTRILGFERIGSHRFGELACRSRRIILMLDIAAAYEKLRTKKNRIFRELCMGLEPALQKVLEESAVRAA
ncbi:MAG: GNAT family N-acetyltransferase [Acidobacteria bacterium]|nr:GNAT family N-acetyltransferase [Acidobacteriota bacterium]